MHHEDLLSVQLHHLDGVAVLSVRGEIDGHTAPHLRESIKRACELGVPVALDMQQVTFMDSTGLAAVIAASGFTDGIFSSVKITRPSRQVRRLLEIAGLDEILLGDQVPCPDEADSDDSRTR